MASIFALRRVEEGWCAYTRRLWLHDAHSLSADLANAYADAARQAGNEVELVNLGNKEFDPVLRSGYYKHMAEDPCIMESQELLEWCEHLTVVSPSGGPVSRQCSKGGLTASVCPGGPTTIFQVRPERLLSGRTATIVATSHAPTAYARFHPAYPVSRIAKHVLSYCGIKTTQRLVFGGIDGKNDNEADIRAFIGTVESAARVL
ncbi:NAD(P)H-dependent oxidoreductase [Trueperella pecoris]|nr:NAD(P)H-dependent oxidoreductase [Trueperella pecoris]